MTHIQQSTKMHIAVFNRSIAIIETTNKSVKQLLRAELVGQSIHADWAQYVNKVVMHLNTTPRMPAGQSPHYLVYGREKTMTGDEHKLLVDF